MAITKCDATRKEKIRMRTIVGWQLTGFALIVASSGCSRNAPPPGPPLAPAHPVHGRVIFLDQSPLRGGIVYFTPTETEVDGLIRYEAAGLVDANGRYK